MPSLQNTIKLFYDTRPFADTVFFAMQKDSNHVRKPRRWLASTSANTGRYLYFVFPFRTRENEMQANPSVSTKKSLLEPLPKSKALSKDFFIR